MGYLFLTFSLLASTTKGYCGKMVSGHLSATKDSLMANIIRMPFCMIIGFVIVLFSGDLKQLVPSAKLLMVAALSGISTAIAVVTWLIAVKKSAYMMLDIALMLGVLIPIIAGYFEVSLDVLFDYDATQIKQKVEDILDEASRYFWRNFEKAEEIYLTGIESYPGAFKLKDKLLTLYECHMRSYD